MSFTLLIKLLFWVTGFLVAIASLLPMDQLPSLATLWWDKAEHAVAFWLLGSLGIGAYRLERQYVLIFGLLAFGASIEIAQSISGWRDGEIADLLADGVGLLAAVITVYSISALKRCFSRD